MGAMCDTMCDGACKMAGLRWDAMGFDRPARFLPAGHDFGRQTYFVRQFFLCRPITDDFFVGHPFFIFHFTFLPFYLSVDSSV
jgi:hypothetical protein